MSEYHTSSAITAQETLIGRHFVYRLPHGDSVRGVIRKHLGGDRYTVTEIGWITGRTATQTLQFNANAIFRLFNTSAEVKAWLTGWDDGRAFEYARSRAETEARSP